MIKKYIIIIITLLISGKIYAAINNDFATFDQIFSEWTNAFNKRDLNKSCVLFSKSVIADYQGVSQRNYDIICNQFKKIFNNQKIRYEYQYKLHHVYRENNLAAVRITWFFHIFKEGKLVSKTQDEGMDIFEFHNGKWQIINYLAYPANREKSDSFHQFLSDLR